MAASITITSNEPGPMGKFGQYTTELLKLVGSSSVALDTGVITTKFVVPVGAMGGAFAVSYNAASNGGAATITATPALGSQTTYLTIFGFAK